MRELIKIAELYPNWNIKLSEFIVTSIILTNQTAGFLGERKYNHSCVAHEFAQPLIGINICYT